MAIEKKELMDLIEHTREQHKAFCDQRTQAQNNIQQLVGAIYACESLIKKMEESLADNKEPIGETQDDNANH
jgi:peptidoglycan hydrolase CwlO-like protein